MKIILVVLIAVFSSVTQAKTHSVTGEPARLLMEAMIGANMGYTVNVENPLEFWDDHGWSRSYTVFVCTYSKTALPDGMISGPLCETEPGPIGTGIFTLPNPLSLIKALQAYAYDEGGETLFRTRILGLGCDVLLATSEYKCGITTSEP